MGDSDDEDGDRNERRRGKKPRRQREPKDSRKKKKVVEDDDGLTAKQRRKVVSKAIISSSEGSDSDGEKLKIAEGWVFQWFPGCCFWLNMGGLFVGQLGRLEIWILFGLFKLLPGKVPV